MTKKVNKNKIEEKKMNKEKQEEQTKAQESVEEVEETDKEKKSDKKEKKKSGKKAEKKSKTEKLQEQYKELNDKYLRLSAEFDNYRKRCLKEKTDLIKSAGEDILVNILPVMDNFERAMKSMEENQDIDAVKEGINLIYGSFKDFLSQKGIKEIEAIGKELDTDKHEAISQIPAPKEEMKGKIIDTIEKGYELNGKIIRFAKVVVGI